MGVAAAVGPHDEWSSDSGVAHPPHRLPQEVGRAPRRVGSALAQPRHQHVAGAGGHGQQRVIAPPVGVAVVAGTLLGQAVGLADGGVQVDGEWCVAGTGPGSPGPGQQLPAHPVQLADVAPTEAAQQLSVWSSGWAWDGKVPRGCGFDHGVADGEQFAHACGEGYFGCLPSSPQPLVKGSDRWIVLCGYQRCHVQYRPQLSPTSPHSALPPHGPAVPIVGSSIMPVSGPCRGD